MADEDKSGWVVRQVKVVTDGAHTWEEEKIYRGRAVLRVPEVMFYVTLMFLGSMKSAELIVWVLRSI